MKTKLIKVIIYIFITIFILLALSFIPTLYLKTKDMNMLKGKWIDVYYQKEEDAARDIFNLLEEESLEIIKRLGIKEKQDVAVYIYDSQFIMQSKKYGFIIPLFGMSWYIGDNIGTNVILTSPANSGKVHNYDAVKYSAPHELVHAYITTINPQIGLWLTEGMALYLTNGSSFAKELIKDNPIPSYKDILTKNPIHFKNMKGYMYANTYIECIEKHYGWSKVLKLIETNNYEEVFSKSREDIYKEWVRYLNNYEN